MKMSVDEESCCDVSVSLQFRLEDLTARSVAVSANSVFVRCSRCRACAKLTWSTLAVSVWLTRVLRLCCERTKRVGLHRLTVEGERVCSRRC